MFRSPALDGTAARRSSGRRRSSTAGEQLENRTLLTALIINNNNVDSFVNASTGNLAITNATLGSHDEIVIEEVDIASIGEGISIDLSNVALTRLAIETVNVTAFAGTAIDINLTNVTGNHTIALEDITIVDSGAGIDVLLDGTNVYGLTVEDSVLPSVAITATNGSLISNGVVTQNEVSAPANLEGVRLTVNSGASADDFQIIDNRRIEALNRDAVQVNLTDAPTDGLRIVNNVIGNEPGADVFFRASGDTFVQPFELTNNGTDGELLEQFILDLRSLDLVFDEGVDGKPFTITGGTAGIGATSTLSSNNQILTVDFTNFTPGDTVLFVIDIDRAPDVPGGPPVAAPIFGNDLIGAEVTFNFDAGQSGTVAKQVAGAMIGDADTFNASLFARGAGAAANVHGVNLNLSNSLLTNTQVTDNTITGVAGHGILFDAKDVSDITGLIDRNTITSGGQDGIRFDLEDSDFTGAIRTNTIGQNSGHGIFFQPSVSRSGFVEEAFDGSPVVITSTNHGLQTGDVIVIQGMTNANPSIVHPGNGIHTVTRLSNNTFALQGISGLGAGINYNAGGAWYVPDFLGGVVGGVPQGPAQGLVTIDVQGTQPEGRITAIQNPGGGGDVQITSVGHGLSSGDRVRIAGATGTLLDGDYKITVIDDDTFSLDSATAGGTYDTSDGLARWRTNLITGATNPVTGEIVVTSLAHGLETGDQIRVANVGGNTAANGTHTITRLSADTFALQGTTANGVYAPNTGFWTPIAETTFTGDSLPQLISNNSITENNRSGIYVSLNTGTRFDGDIVRNTVSANLAKGIHIASHSYGVGQTLPLNPADPLALPGKSDISFDVNIGSDVATTGGPFGIPLDGNVLDGNGHAGVVVEVLDLATGSFEIQGNKITSSVDDADALTGWAGDGVYVALESDQFAVDSNALLAESLIQNNIIGVDSQGNDGNGLNFRLRERTRIQDLEVLNNFFGNNSLDGFHFERTENGSLNAVVMDDNDATNNLGDGFDLFAENSVDDRLDFKISRNDINNNAEYGVRINVQAAARIEVEFNTNDVVGNGHTPNGNGYHPDDAAPNFTGHENGTNFAGNAGAAGGVGIFGFEEVEVVFNATDSRISGNIGDGFSIDTFDAVDTFRLDASFTDVEINSNTLTGFRSHGAAFASIDFISSTFNRNREDGVRIVSIEDKDDFFRRRVAGADIDIMAIGNQFVGNWHNGAVLGQAVSAVFGTGSTTAEFANIFDSNGFTDPTITGLPRVNTGGDGLKITQNVGPYLHKLGRRRVIESDSNFFRNNGGDGIDVGHDVALEGGNVEHGYEVASDVDVVVNNAVISGNSGDGIEYLADSILRIPPLVGSQQEIANPTDISSLQVSNSRIESNNQRGIDILNRVSEDSRITLTDNEVLTNRLSGVYVVNSSSHSQTQFGPDDALHVETSTPAGLRTPNIELRVQSNNILDNGNQASVSTVTIPSSGPDDSSGTPNPDWTHDYTTVTGTLGGLVIRVGTADSVDRLLVANPEFELGHSGVDAEVVSNTFNGNFGASAFFDAFVSTLPPQSQGEFDDDAAGHPGFIDWRQGYRDPLSRFDLVFRGNSGNSLDVVNGFAFVDNNEDYFKSRHFNRSTSPPHDHAHGAPTLTPGGHFNVPGTLRARISTRTSGFFNSVGQVPGSTFQGTGFEWSYDGHGTPTWRVESDYDFNNFAQTSTTQGFSTFHDTVILANSIGYEYQWDTGRNTSNFTGLTPYSLFRGDVFNVDDGEDPIEADGLEENDSFMGATDLGVVAGAGFSVNALTNGSLQPGVLNIDRKGDRDYYKFTTASVFSGGGSTGIVDVNLGTVDGLGNALDPDGDLLRFMVYEVRPQTDTEEVPLIAVDGIPQYTTVNNGSVGNIQVAVKAGTTYIIEILSQEGSNLGTSGGGTGGTRYIYGTTRGYTLSIDAPVAQPPVIAAPATAPASNTTTASSPGVTAPVNVPDEAPTVQDITDIQANPSIPINVSVNTITVSFSEDVTGVTLSDFQLTRDGAVLDMSGAIFNPIDLETYEITNLAPLTNVAGDYVFSVLINTSGIVDTDQEALVAGGNDSESWTLDNTVNSTVDARDNVPGDGFIADSNGNRTLRAAINEANANIGADVIVVAPGTYILDLEGRFEDEGFTGDLDIRESLTIRGTGATAGDTVIDANQLDRVFHVFPGVELILENLTIQGGEAYDGGGLLIEGTATQSGLTAGSGGIVRLSDVNVIDNEAFNQGGGIYNLGVVDALRSSISRNAAGSRGGGIFNHGDVDLVNSTISTNTAVSRGGGVYNERLSSAVNTTIRPVQTVGTLYALNSTIAFNAAGAKGGGLYQEGSASFQIGNTIIDRNTAQSSPDLRGTVNSLGFNFIGDLDGTPADALLQSTDTAADATAGVTEAGLQPLTSNGPNGVWHNPLIAAAYAIDRGSDSLYATQRGIQQSAIINDFDQVRNPRQVEGDNDGTFRIDIGAAEYFVSQPVAIITATPNPAGVNETVTLSAASSTHTLVPGNSRITLYEWDFLYDGVTFNALATGVTATTSYPSLGQFTVALRVTDDTGATDLETLVIDVSAPSPPVVTAPFSAGTSDSTPTIAWTAGTGTFSLTVTNVGTGATVITQTGLTAKTFTPTTALAAGTYSVEVTASNASGTAVSAPYQFTVLTMSIIDPAHQDIEFDTTPEFLFTAIPNADRYQVWVSQQNPDNRPQSIGIPINDSFIDAANAAVPGTNQAAYEAGVSLGEGVYRVWVRALEADGNAGDWSTGHQFFIVRPEVTGPVVSGTATIDSTPTITWTDVGAPRYEIWLTQLNGTAANGVAVTSPQLVANVRGIQTTSYTPTTPLGNGDFRFWVRALDDTGEPGLWSRQYNFTKNLTVGPTQISPINKVTVTDRTPEFQWEALAGATHYELWVNNLNTGQARIIHNTNVPHVDGATTISYTDPDVVLRNASYRWWVRAFNEDGEAGAWTAFAQFFVPTPVMTAPVGTVVGTNLPTFSWTSVPEYVRFELWVNNVDTGVSRVIYQPNLTTTTFTPTLPLENGNFRVWVRAFDAVGNPSQWSNPSNFTVDASIGNSPTLVSPSGFEFDNTPQFVWNSLTSVTQYEILVKNMLTTGQPIVLNLVVTPVTLTGGTVGYTPTTNLAQGTYRWWVRGVNADGDPGPWAQPLDFRVVSSDVPSLQRDEDGPAPEVLLATLPAAADWADDLHSITVHPAAVVATIVTDDSLKTSAQDESADAVTVEQDFDAVMSELATADWWQVNGDETADRVGDIPLAEVAADQAEVSATVARTESERDMSRAAAWGMGLGLIGHGRRRFLNRRKRTDTAED
ncbi:MAG: PKD domain-containing protein [Fuerstiella sp.]